MIDKERRKVLAFHLRQLSVGITTNDDFENGVMEDVSDGWLPEQYYRSKRSRFDDPIILPMLELCWGLYDDTKQHKLKGKHQLTNEALQIIARCILFLHSDRNYEWPYLDLKFSLKDFIFTFLTLGFYWVRRKRKKMLAYKEWQNIGDYNVWPFFRTVDYNEALKICPFLGGK